MKHIRHHDRGPSAGPLLVPVRFEFIHPTAQTVCIAGTFNDWQPEAKPMHLTAAGHWLKETVLPPGTHEYCLVVDGQWMADPLAEDYVPNPFGGKNSILKVASSAAMAPLADAENLPLKNANN